MKVYVVNNSCYFGERVFSTAAAAREYVANMIRRYRRDGAVRVSTGWAGHIWDLGDTGECISLFAAGVES